MFERFLFEQRILTMILFFQVVPEDTKKADWRVYYGPVKDQGNHGRVPYSKRFSVFLIMN